MKKTMTGKKGLKGEFQKTLEEFKKDLTTDIQFRGHFCERHMSKESREELSIYIEGCAHLSVLLAHLQMLKDDIHTGYDSFVGTELDGGYSGCDCCGKRLKFKVIKTKKGLRLRSTTKCRYPDGYPEFKVKLKVPSGEILLFNDLRGRYEDEKMHSMRCDLNTTPGDAKYTREFAKRGLATIFVGNTCPGVHQVNRKRLLVGTSKGGERAKTIGSICTDLWRFCAVDRAGFENQIGKTVDTFEKEYHDSGRWPDVVRAKVRPGIYEVSSRYHRAKDNDVYSIIQWVGEIKGEEA